MLFQQLTLLEMHVPDDLRMSVEEPRANTWSIETESSEQRQLKLMIEVNTRPKLEMDISLLQVFSIKKVFFNFRERSMLFGYLYLLS